MVGNDEHECHCVLHEPPNDITTWTDGDRRLVEEVRTIGWSLVKVVEPTDGWPWWVFTVGLWHSFGTPELVMGGLRAEDMPVWLTAVAQRIRDGAPPLQPDEAVTDVLDGFALRVREVHEGWYRPLLGYSRWFAHPPPLPFQQLVWPDRHGRYPWDGCEGGCATDQPRLWIAPEDHPDGRWKSYALEA
jgi:Domain of unknown function (DUF4262)